MWLVLVPVGTVVEVVVVSTWVNVWGSVTVLVTVRTSVVSTVALGETVTVTGSIARRLEQKAVADSAARADTTRRTDFARQTQRETASAGPVPASNTRREADLIVVGRDRR